MKASDRPVRGHAPAGADGVGRWLVTLQFSLLAVMGWRVAVSPSSLGTLAIAWVSGAAMLAVWALAANRPGNFNIRPVPRSGGTLVTNGPYRWIRHPMYTSLLMAAAAPAVTSHEIADGGLWVALLAVLVVKAGVEERALMLHFPDYPAYKARTTRFLPWLV